jgi:peptidoglycan/LPS O-acetylase OafA/YrhL
MHNALAPQLESRMAHPSYRPDIDGLRAIAVIPVLLFHTFPDCAPGGFVGVDVFFVISGFLISTIFFKDFDRNSFNLAEFYRRRIRRIFPALLTVLIACLAIGWFILLPNEYTQLGEHVVASAAFAQNFMLWSETGYFDTQSNLKPLLHIWSLGIEEQFYIAWPLLLWIGWKTNVNLLLLTLAVAIASFASCMLLVGSYPSTAFYFPVTRFWELLIGAALAHLMLHQSHRFKRFGGFRSIAGIAMLAWSFVEISSANFPCWQALVPTIGTALVISAGENALANRFLLSLRPIVWVGLISYPLYLWHWPLLAFSRILAGNVLPLRASVAIIITSILLSWATYTLIEKPIRSQKYLANRAVVLLCCTSLFAAAGGLLVILQRGITPINRIDQAYNNLRAERHPPFSSAECISRYGSLFDGGFILVRDFCLLEERKKPSDILLIGDSHAWPLFEGMIDLGWDGITLVGRGSCAPMLNAPTVEWLKCQPTGDRIIDFAVASNFKTIILTGTFQRYFDGTYGPQSSELIEDDIKRNFAKLAQSNKPVLIVLDNPSLPFDSPDCLRRPISFKPKLECSFERSFYESKSEKYRELFYKFSAIYPTIKVIDAVQNFCTTERCFAYNKGGLLYRSGDNNHLNVAGARLVVQTIVEQAKEFLPTNKPGKSN